MPDSRSHEGVELEEGDPGFTIIIQTPGVLRLTFEKLEVVRLEDRLSVVEPWVMQDFSVLLGGGELPSASDWILMMGNAGIKAKWNFCGDADAATPHPAPFQYDGWCLQVWDSGGLEEAVFLINSELGGYSLHIEKRGVGRRLWDAVCRAAAASQPQLSEPEMSR